MQGSVAGGSASQQRLLRGGDAGSTLLRQALGFCAAPGGVGSVEGGAGDALAGAVRGGTLAASAAGFAGAASSSSDELSSSLLLASSSSSSEDSSSELDAAWRAAERQWRMAAAPTAATGRVRRWGTRRRSSLPGMQRE